MNKKKTLIFFIFACIIYMATFPYYTTIEDGFVITNSNMTNHIYVKKYVYDDHNKYINIDTNVNHQQDENLIIIDHDHENIHHTKIIEHVTNYLSTVHFSKDELVQIVITFDTILDLPTNDENVIMDSHEILSQNRINHYHIVLNPKTFIEKIIEIVYNFIIDFIPDYIKVKSL